MTKEQYRKYRNAVEHNLAGLSFISTGACKDCDECGLPEDPSDGDLDLASEPHFSWWSCDSCGSTLGGDRHPAHGRMSDGALLHLSICTDCLYYLNYGQLDDTTMLEMENQ